MLFSIWVAAGLFLLWGHSSGIGIRCILIDVMCIIMSLMISRLSEELDHMKQELSSYPNRIAVASQHKEPWLEKVSHHLLSLYSVS